MSIRPSGFTVPLRNVIKALLGVISVILVLTSLTTTPESIFKPLKIGEREYYYLCPLLTGGLGNSMFVYASAYGIAAATGRKLMLEFNNLDPVFEELEGNVTDIYCNFLPEIHSKYHCAFDETVLNLNPKTNYKIGDYLQSYKYFEKQQREIRKLFTFKSHLLNTTYQFLSKVADEFFRAKAMNKAASSGTLTYVGIHVRRGDMLNTKFYSDYGYVVPNETYVNKAMEFMEKRFNNVVFILASNDMKWAKAQFQRSNIVFTPYTDATNDLVLLSSCNHSITTVGSYGWWSAYLAGGTTVYYKYPAREGSQLREHFSSDYSDFFMPEWIGLN